MLEVWAVFDAPDAVLHQELKNVKLALPSADGEERARLLALRDTIQQELSERSGSQSLLQQLLPIVQGSTPDTFADDVPALLAAAANAPSALQKDLLELVQAGQRIANLRSAAPSAPQQHTPAVHAGAAPAGARVPEPQQRTAWGSPGGQHHGSTVSRPAHEAVKHAVHAQATSPAGGAGVRGGGGSLPTSAHPRTQLSRPLVTPVGRPQSSNALTPLPAESSQSSGGGAHTRLQDGMQWRGPDEAEVVAEEEPCNRPVTLSGIQAGLRSKHEGEVNGEEEVEEEPSAIAGDAPSDVLNAQASVAAASEQQEGGVEASDSKKKKKRRKKKAEAEEGPPKPQMTVLEAALAAFQEEQRKLHKARKAISKGQPKLVAAGPGGQVTRTELVAMYRGPPLAQQPPQRAPHMPAGLPGGVPVQLQQQTQVPLAVADDGANSQGDGAVHAQVPHHVLYPPAVQGPATADERQGTGPISSHSSGAASIVEEELNTTGAGAVISDPHPADPNKRADRPIVQARAAGEDVGKRQQYPQESFADSSSSYETDTEDTGSYVTEDEEEGEERSAATLQPVAKSMQQSMQHQIVVRPGSHSFGGAQLQTASQAGLQAGGIPQVPNRPSSAAAGPSGQQGIDKEAAIAAYLQRPEFQVSPIELSFRGANAMESVRVVGDDHGEEAAQGAGLGGRVDRWSDWDMGDNQGVSAWGREAEDDPLASALRDMRTVPRAPSHVPPQSLPGRRPPPAPSSSTSPLPLPSQAPVTAAGYGSLLQARHADARQPTGQQEMQDNIEKADVPSTRPSSARTATQQQAQEAPQPQMANGGVFTTITSSRRQLVTQAVTTAAAGDAQTTAGVAESVSMGDVPNAASSSSTVPHVPEGKLGTAQASSASAGALATRRPSSASPSLSRPHPTQPSVPGAVYAQHFNVFHDVLTICYSGGPGALIEQAVLSAAGAPGSGLGTGLVPRPMSRGLPSFSVCDVIDKLQGLGLRLAAWQQELERQQQQRQQQQLGLRRNQASSGTPSPWVRYYACADDTAHPEVRQVLALALGRPGSGSSSGHDAEGAGAASVVWELDPADQITEPAQPDSDDDTQDPPTVQGFGNSQGTAATPPQLTSVPASQYSQARSPLVGRCNMWNLLWSWSLKARAPLSDLLVWQRVNHFPEAKQLTRKDLLKKHLVRYQVMHGSHVRLGHLFSCLPTTFVLPKEMDAATDAFQRAVHGVEPSVTQPKGLNLWIAKPVGKSRGRGIRLVRSLRDLASGPGGAGSLEDPIVLQRYVTNPLTVQGYKFDLRLYVLVTSFNPLEAWICTEGFARFATLPFSLEEDHLSNKFVHLTNSSVQKARSAKGELPPFLAQAQPPGGSKLSLTQLRSLLAEQKVEWSVVWSRITDVVTACLFAAQDAIPPCVNAFELFGFDVLIDTSGSVWVLEVNSSPSLSTDTPLDRAIKPRMLRDAIAIVDPLPYDRAALAEVVAARSSAKGKRGAQRAGGGGLAGVRAESERDLMCSDLQAILGGRVPRKYGEVPVSVGGADDSNWFQCIAPSPLLEKLVKLRGRGGRAG